MRGQRCVGGCLRKNKNDKLGKKSCKMGQVVIEWGTHKEMDI